MKKILIVFMLFSVKSNMAQIKSPTFNSVTTISYFFKSEKSDPTIITLVQSVSKFLDAAGKNDSLFFNLLPTEFSIKRQVSIRAGTIFQINGESFAYLKNYIVGQGSKQGNGFIFFAEESPIGEEPIYKHPDKTVLAYMINKFIWTVTVGYILNQNSSQQKM